MTTLQIVGLVYAISWFILFCVYLGSRFSKDYHRNVSPWYIYLIMVVGAPICVLIIPFLGVSMIKERRANKLSQEETEKREREEQERMEIAQRNYTLAAAKYSSTDSPDFVLVAKRLLEVVGEKEYGLIQEVLDKASLPNGHSLCVEPCNNDSPYLGEVSKLFISTPSGIDNREVFDTLRFEDSRMGAWQAFLLHQITSYLPLWWHANYGRRDYLYTTDEISRIRHFTEEKPDLSHYSDKDLAPAIIPSGEHYFVSCCYWSEFHGLIREFVQLTLKDGLLSDFLVFEERTLYSYDCGIMF